MQPSVRSPSWSHAVAAALVGALVVTLAVGAGYEALFALGVIGYSASATHGSPPPYETAILQVTLCVMLAAVAGFAVAATWGRASRAVAGLRWLWLVPVFCAALVIARYYSFDPYDSPNLIRVSEEVDAHITAIWLPAGIAAAVATRKLATRGPRAIMVGAAVMLFVAAVTTAALTSIH